MLSVLKEDQYQFEVFRIDLTENQTQSTKRFNFRLHNWQTTILGDLLFFYCWSVQCSYSNHNNFCQRYILVQLCWLNALLAVL